MRASAPSWRRSLKAQRSRSVAPVTFTRAGRTQSLRIVGEDEADPKRGTLSWRSPLAQALMGGEAGDIVEMTLPKGEIEIVRVEN
ncbi:MAG: GreA/GreB family elongation factor [Rhizomicrobium sp.]